MSPGTTSHNPCPAIPQLMPPSAGSRPTPTRFPVRIVAISTAYSLLWISNEVRYLLFYLTYGEPKANIVGLAFDLSLALHSGSCCCASHGLCHDDSLARRGPLWSCSQALLGLRRL